ncbi:hypothetical protein H0H81_012631 [Sphagnurus paluster]|uniref:Uncharacterized protein n=1 Tax=Sphagnurus paluster TaxID=117069 RepID=A0A9P7FTF3_9AGAR|nr:hypothetical protein H0H81_012631 [Sphagnurus paluster]
MSQSSLPLCIVPGNPDIAGIGVRAATYVQACLASFNLLYICKRVLSTINSDKSPVEPAADVEKEPSPPLGSAIDDHTKDCNEAKVNPDDAATGSIPTLPQDAEAMSTSSMEVNKVVEENSDFFAMERALERSILMIGFAIILSAILAARSSTGLSAYHAVVVLNVSQINNWSGYLLLHLSQRLRASRITGPALTRRFYLTKDTFKASIPCIMHSMVMAGFGLYFWSDVNRFLRSTVEEPCQPATYFWVFVPVHVSNRTLRIISLVYYSISIVPMLDLYLLTFIIWFNFILIGSISLVLVTLLLLVFIPIFGGLYFALIHPLLKFVIDPISIRKARSRKEEIPPILPSQRFRAKLMSIYKYFDKHDWVPLIMVPVVVVVHAPLVYSIISTELTIHINKNHVTASENDWTYGQTLALFSALVAIYLYMDDFFHAIKKRKSSKLRTE